MIRTHDILLASNIPGTLLNNFRSVRLRCRCCGAYLLVLEPLHEIRGELVELVGQVPDAQEYICLLGAQQPTANSSSITAHRLQKARQSVTNRVFASKDKKHSSFDDMLQVSAHSVAKFASVFDEGAICNFDCFGKIDAVLGFLVLSTQRPGAASAATAYRDWLLLVAACNKCRSPHKGGPRASSRSCPLLLSAQVTSRHFVVLGYFAAVDVIS